MSDGSLHVVLLAQAAATLIMTGVIWFVQIVHYPLFARVGRERFAEYARQHTRTTGFVVAGPMLVELGTAILLAWHRRDALAALGLALVILIWLTTWLAQVPAHRRLEKGFDDATNRRLVGLNWIRTLAWTTRSVVALALLPMPR